MSVFASAREAMNLARESGESEIVARLVHSHILGHDIQHLVNESVKGGYLSKIGGEIAVLRAREFVTKAEERNLFTETEPVR